MERMVLGMELHMDVSNILLEHMALGFGHSMMHCDRSSSLLT
jgi:hypothetical protein